MSRTRSSVTRTCNDWSIPASSPAPAPPVSEPPPSPASAPPVSGRAVAAGVPTGEGDAWISAVAVGTAADAVGTGVTSLGAVRDAAFSPAPHPASARTAQDAKPNPRAIRYKDLPDG